MKSLGKLNKILNRQKQFRELYYLTTIVVQKQYECTSFHALFGYSRTVSEDDEATELVDGSIVWLARLHVWVGIVLKCLTENDT